MQPAIRALFLQLRTKCVQSTVPLIAWACFSLFALHVSAKVCWVIANRFHAPPTPGDVKSGAILDHCVRAVKGDHIFVAPSVAFVPNIYTPGFYYVTGGLIRVLGSDLYVARLSSLLLLGGSTLIMAILSWHITHNRHYPPFVVAIAFCGYSLTSYGYDLPRVDAAATLSLATSIWILVLYNSIRSGILLGVVLALGFWCKQTTVVYSTVVLLTMLMLEPKRAVVAACTTTLALGATIALANVATNGWFWIYVIDVPCTHAFPMDKFVHSLKRDWLGSLGIAASITSIAAVMLIASWRGGQGERQIGKVLTCFVGLVALGVVSRSNKGSTAIVLIPIATLGGSVVPLALWFIYSRLTSASVKATACLVAALVMMAYAALTDFEPSHVLQSEYEDHKWDELRGLYESYLQGGPVWHPWGSAAPFDSVSSFASQMAMVDYLGGRYGELRSEFALAQMRKLIRRRYFSAILVKAVFPARLKYLAEHLSTREVTLLLRHDGNALSKHLGLFDGAYKVYQFVPLENEENETVGMKGQCPGVAICVPREIGKSR